MFNNHIRIFVVRFHEIMYMAERAVIQHFRKAKREGYAGEELAIVALLYIAFMIFIVF